MGKKKEEAAKAAEIAKQENALEGEAVMNKDDKLESKNEEKIEYKAGDKIAKGGNLARIEELLEKQNEYSKKLLFRANIRTVAVAIVAVVAIVVMIVFIGIYGALMNTLAQLPPLINSAELLVESLNTEVSDVLSEALTDLQKIDIDKINSAVGDIGVAAGGLGGVVDGLGEIDFGALNSSITNLAEGTEGFKTFVDGLKSFSLFG